MLEKRRIIAQWVLFGLSIIILAAFLAVLFTTVTVPYRQAKYQDSYVEDNGHNITLQVSLSGNNSYTANMYDNGVEGTDIHGVYRVDDGKLYLLADDSTEYEAIGNIDSYTLQYDGHTLQCSSTYTWRTICIVFISIGGAMFIGSMLWIIIYAAHSKVVLRTK